MNEKKADSSLINILNIILTTILIAAIFPHPAKASELTILFSNDIRGETDPCG